MNRQEKIDVLLYRLGFIDIFPNSASIESMKNNSTLSIKKFSDAFISLTYDRFARTQLDNSIITQLLAYKIVLNNRPFLGQSVYDLSDDDFQRFFDLTNNLIVRTVKFINGHEFNSE